MCLLYKITLPSYYKDTGDKKQSQAAAKKICQFQGGNQYEKLHTQQTYSY